MPLIQHIRNFLRKTILGEDDIRKNTTNYINGNVKYEKNVYNTINNYYDTTGKRLLFVLIIIDLLFDLLINLLANNIQNLLNIISINIYISISFIIGSIIILVIIKFKKENVKPSITSN